MYIIVISQSHLLLLLLDLTISALDSQTLCPEKEGGGEREREKGRKREGGGEEGKRGGGGGERGEGEVGWEMDKGKGVGVEEWMGQEYMWKGKGLKAPNPTHMYHDFINSLSWRFT